MPPPQLLSADNWLLVVLHSMIFSNHQGNTFKWPKSKQYKIIIPIPTCLPLCQFSSQLSWQVTVFLVCVSFQILYTHISRYIYKEPQEVSELKAKSPANKNYIL